jgi:hypothetical protein
MSGAEFSGEMSLVIADLKVQGLARFTSRTPDRDFEGTPITGAATAGLLIATMYTSFGGTPAVVTLVTPVARTTFNQMGGTVVWSELGRESVVGSFSATRRVGGQPATIPAQALQLLPLVEKE